MLPALDEVRKAVRLATDEAVQEGRAFSVVDAWARSRAAMVMELLQAARR